jgi:hypothetical protein
VATKSRKVGKKLLVDLDELQFMPKIIVDGQNVAFEHGDPIAEERGWDRYFSYEGLFMAIEKIYRCGFAPKVVIPQIFIMNHHIEGIQEKETIKHLGKDFRNEYYTLKDATKSVAEYIIDRVTYYKKYEVFEVPNGEGIDWHGQRKKDDTYALKYAFQNEAKILSNDKYKKELEEFGEDEPGIWEDWLAENRLGFSFGKNEYGSEEFIPEDLTDEYKNPASYEELKRQSGLLKYWEEFEASMNRTAYEFAHWSDLI